MALKVYDDQARAPSAARRPSCTAITKDHCSVILGGWDSSVVLAEIEEAHRLATPFFVSYAWSSAITQAGYPEVVRIGPNNDILASAFVPFMQTRRYRHVALLADDTAFGRGLSGAIRATSPVAGIDVRLQEFKRDLHDLRPALKSALAGKPDALVIAAAPGHPARLLAISQARAGGYKGDIVLGWDYVDEAFWKATGKSGVGRHLAHVLGPDAASDRRGTDVQARVHRSATSISR